MEHGVLTPLGLFTEAGPVAKAVMLLLVLASIWCWVLIVEGAWSLRRLNRAIQASRRGSDAGDAALLDPALAAGRQAAALTLAGESAGELRARIGEAMSRTGEALLTQIQGGLPNLAVIASVAPFIGLFGTVWGIMTSFAGIAEAKDTSLAVVAPGIAEALAATAIGLAAAIPASVGYNRIGAALARAGQELSHLVEERTIDVSRQRPAMRDMADRPLGRAAEVA